MTATFCAPPNTLFARVLRKPRALAQLGSRARWRASASRGRPRVITTPLYYVNAAPHMGSAYPTIAADALARFTRLTGEEAVFVTGVDEHGEKIAAAAAAAGKAPEEFCDGIAGQFKELWSELDVRYDRFVRTTRPEHKWIVAEFMERVWNNGDIYRSSYEGLYCTDCEEYKDEKELLEGGVCAIHLKPCEERKEENYFFALSKYQERLEKFLEDNPDFVQPAKRRNEVLGWVRDGLRDFSVSRAHNDWGIPVPRDESQTIYVWFDALLGYISSLLLSAEGASLDDALQSGWPASVHIIGKDILRFHAVYWPAMLMSAGVELPGKVFGHGFITKDGTKMGKSLGNTVDPRKLVGDYGADAVRYYFLKAVDFGRDGDFSERRFVDVVNADLANSLGNLLNRSLNLLRKNCGGTLPVSSADLEMKDATQAEIDLRQAVARAAEDAKSAYDSLNFVDACEAVIGISTKANVYIDSVAPWKGFKSEDPTQQAAAARCVVNVLEAARIVAVGLSPVTPLLSKKVYASLGIESEFDGLVWESAMSWGRLEAGMQFAKPKPVFPRMEMMVAVEPQPAVV